MSYRTPLTAEAEEVLYRVSQSSRDMAEDPSLEEVAEDMMGAVQQAVRSPMIRVWAGVREEVRTMTKNGLVEALKVRHTQT